MHGINKLVLNKYSMNLYGVIIWMTLTQTIECMESDEEPHTLVVDFVQHFMKPFIESLQVRLETSNSTQKVSLRSEPRNMIENIKSPVTKAIHETVAGLRPFLQDDDHDFEKHITQDETTIIEIIPRPERTDVQAHIPNISKYEKKKYEIQRALDRENVSEKTKRAVTQTLDDLIAQLLNNQCFWNTYNISSSSYKIHNIATLLNRRKEQSITQQEWEDLKTQYLEFLSTKRERNNRALQAFNEFHRFFSKVINETQSMYGKLKFKCQVIEEKLDAIMRSGQDCREFKVCSNELRDFLDKVYDAVNETTVSVYRNYAAMYIRDVSADEDEGREYSVPNVLENTANAVEKRVAKIFLKDIPTLRLDTNKTENSNVRILRNIVRRVKKDVLRNMKKHMEDDLEQLEYKFRNTVEKDIYINLDVELGNLETDLKERVCAVFVTCNGRVDRSRRVNSQNQPINPNSIFVKLQLNVGDKLQDILLSNKFAKVNNKKKSDKRLQAYVTRTTMTEPIELVETNLI